MNEDQEELDPRVQVELERLNTSTDEINRLEAQLEEANNVFRTTLTESSARLKALSKKLGSCIEKARPYYEAVEEARISQLDCQRAAVQYQRANALHTAAKETIALAEERFIRCKDENWQFDSAWQEMLNHATIKVMEAEAQKAASEREHMKRASAYSQMQLRVQQLQRGLKSAINKSSIYFDQKAHVQTQLNSQKENVQELQRSITANKTTYAQTLRSLEQISEEIHEARRCRLPREPGVGAEINVPTASENSQLKRHGSAINVHIALEEKTAEEEKYWESLREKLEEMKTNNKDSLEEGGEEISADFLDLRQRSLTGSSQVEDLERIVSGESETEDKSDSEEIVGKSISLQNINLCERELGVGSENDIILTGEDNFIENSKDSMVGIGNENKSRSGCQTLGNDVMNEISQDCNVYSSFLENNDLSCKSDVFSNQQQSKRRSPMGITFTCKTPELYPSQYEMEESEASLELENNISETSFQTIKANPYSDIYYSDVLLDKDEIMCDKLDKGKDKSASEEYVENSEQYIKGTCDLPNNFQNLNENDKQNSYESCTSIDEYTLEIPKEECENIINDELSYSIKTNELNNVISISDNIGNKNHNNINDNDEKSPPVNVCESSPVQMCKPKAGLAIIPEH